MLVQVQTWPSGALKPLDELNDDQVDRAGDQKRHGEIETLQFITARSSIAASSKSKRAAMSSASPNNSHSRS